MIWLLANWNYIAIISLVVIIEIIARKNNKLLDTIEDLEDDTDALNKTLSKTNSKIASLRIKHGQAWEVYLPLMEKYLKEIGDKNNACFLGKPIDLIYFNEDGIVFVEVKTGDSKLTQKQRKIKKLIEDKKVSWKEVGDGFPEDDSVDRQE